MAFKKNVNKFTYPVPNNFSQPSISFEVTLESDSLTHNNRRQGLYGNCQISLKKKMIEKSLSAKQTIKTCFLNKITFWIPFLQE